MRLLKWISWSLATLVVLVLLCLAVLVLLVDPNRFKAQIESAVREQTGREFALVGDIDLKFFPWLALSTGEGRFGNPPAFGEHPMATWRAAQLGVRLFPLLKGDLYVDRIRLEGADVHLVRRADGTANWQGILGETPAPAESTAPTRKLTIRGADLEDSRIAYTDEGAGLRGVVSALNLSTGEISPDTPFKDTNMAGNLHLEGFPEVGVPFRLVVPRAALTQDYSRLDIDEFELQFGGFEAGGSLAGTLDEPLQLGGEIESEDFDLRALLSSVGIDAPRTTDARTLETVNVAATWRLDDGAVDIDPLAMRIDDTRFTGRFQRAAGEDPVGEFSLRGDGLILDRYLPPADPQSEPFALPTAALRALKFRGVLELEELTYDDLLMKGVTLRLLLDEQGLRSPEAGKINP